METENMSITVLESDDYKRCEEDFISLIKEYKEKASLNLSDKRITNYVNYKISASKIPGLLKSVLKKEQYVSLDAQHLWESIGFLYRQKGQFIDALQIYLAEYEQVLNAQKLSSHRIHKGAVLCWISDSLRELKCFSLSKKFLMLTLIEDAITSSGRIDPETTGAYFRLTWFFGMSHKNFQNYCKRIWAINTKNQTTYFPESILLELDNDWNNEYPSENELNFFIINRLFLNEIYSSIGEKTGNTFEILAQYLLSCIPGIILERRKKSKSTEYDLLCSLNGAFLDFRSELGRFFICESKDWSTKVNSEVIFKLRSVLISTKCRFGILFSREGITGEKTEKFGAREVLKSFQNEGSIILCVDNHDIKKVLAGENLINILRQKYIKTKFDM